jgi:hypothetical protein
VQELTKRLTELAVDEVIMGAIKWGDANFVFPQLRRLRGHTLWPPL